MSEKKKNIDSKKESLWYRILKFFFESEINDVPGYWFKH
jgi:hypothetical protein